MQSIHTRKALFGTAISIALLAAPAVKAEEVVVVPTPETTTTTTTVVAGEHFAAAGQWFVLGETNGNLSATWSSVDGANSVMNLGLSPAVGYFFSDFVYGRLGLNIEWQRQKDVALAGNQFKFEIAPGVGIAAPLKPGVAFAPWVGLTYQIEGIASSVENDKTALGGNNFGFSVNAPFVFDVVEHLSFQVGPYYKQALVSKGKSTNATGTEGPSIDAPKLGSVGINFGVLGHW